MSDFLTNNFITSLAAGYIPWYAALIFAVCAYFTGNINPAILIGKAQGIDIRSQGSGNAGATNAARSLGKKAGAAVFLIDIAKGGVCYFVPLRIWTLASSSHPDTVPASVAMLCGLCVVLGHMYPALFGFKGGKGVSTTLGVMLFVDFRFALLLLGIVVVLTAIFRRVSLSVLVAVAVAVVLVFQTRFTDPLWLIIILALIVWKHRGNIARLARGEESKLTFGSKTKSETESKSKRGKI